MHLPIQPFSRFLTTVFGDYAVVAWSVSEVQARSDSSFVSLRKPSTRRPQFCTKKFQSVSGFHNVPFRLLLSCKALFVKEHFTVACSEASAYSPLSGLYLTQKFFVKKRPRHGGVK